MKSLKDTGVLKLDDYILQFGKTPIWHDGIYKGTFPIPFPHKALSIQVSIERNNSWDFGLNELNYDAWIIDNEHFEIYHDEQNHSATWMAIGY